MKLTAVLFPALFAIAGGCSFRSDLDLEKRSASASFAFYTALSLDRCIQTPLECFSAWGDHVDVPPEFKLVKMLPGTRVFEEVSPDYIAGVDRRTPEGAAFVTAATFAKDLVKSARDAGFTVPNVVLDPLCLMPDSEHNAYFRKEYGPSEKLKVENLICLGFTTQGPNRVPLALDKALFAHEYFHALLSTQLINKDVPEVYITGNHDLDSFNEGMADHFAEVVTGGSLSQWLLTSRGLTWRLPSGRAAIRETGDVFGNIYHDGGRWTELAGALADAGEATLPVLRCTLANLHNAAAKDAKRQTAEGFEPEFRAYNKDILAAMEPCVSSPRKKVFASARDEIFGARAPSDPVTAVSLAVVAIANKDALCTFASNSRLGPESLVWYQYLDPCGESSTIRFNGESVALPQDAQSDHPGFKNEPVVAFVGLKPEAGKNARDCRLRGPRSLKGTELILPTQDGKDEPITLPVPESSRGSWYSEVAFGSFGDVSSADYALPEGPLAALSREYRFIPFRSAKAPRLGGLFFISGFRYPDAIKEKRARDTYLAERLASVFHEGNFTVQCDTPQMSLALSKVDVKVFDCVEGICGF